MMDRRSILLGGAIALSGCAPSLMRVPIAGGLFFIGTNGAALYAARFDARAGTMRLIGAVAELTKPAWSVRHPRLPILYVADNAVSGQVVSFQVDPATGALIRLGAVAAGSGTTYLSLDQSARALLAANYGDGSVASIALTHDGALGERISRIFAAGSGPHRRQTGPHAHAAIVDPSGRYALVPDLGADRLFVYPYDPVSGMLTDDTTGARHVALPAGSGPRHLTFHPNGRVAYLLGELTAEVFILDWNARLGTATLRQALSANAHGFTGNSSVSEIAMSRDGRFVYVANRGDATVVVFAVNARDFTLTPIQRVGAGGEYPWHLRIHPGGRWMIVANERSDCLSLLRIDQRSGMLTAVGATISVPKPVSIMFW